LNLVSLQPHERDYLIAKLTALDAAIENLQRFAHSPGEQAAVEMLIETRTKMAEALAQPKSGVSNAPQGYGEAVRGTELSVAQGFLHTVFKNGQWVNEVEDGEEIGGSHATKEAAVEAGRARARQDKTEHVIHNQDAAISERNSYGNDPVSRPG
jgi:hypothetical protein